MEDDQLSGEQLQRIQRFWTSIAKEEVRIEQISSCLYGFCSEVASLRLFKYFNIEKRNKASKADWSENLQCFYFRLEL